MTVLRNKVKRLKEQLYPWVMSISDTTWVCLIPREDVLYHVGMSDTTWVCLTPRGDVL